jgi:MFS family permease
MLFTAGLVGTGLLATPTLAGSAAYAFGDTFGWRQGLDERFGRAHPFYAVFIASIAIGIALDFAANQSPSSSRRLPTACSHRFSSWASLSSRATAQLCRSSPVQCEPNRCRFHDQVNVLRSNRDVSLLALEPKRSVLCFAGSPRMRSVVAWLRPMV